MTDDEEKLAALYDAVELLTNPLPPSIADLVEWALRYGSPTFERAFGEQLRAMSESHGALLPWPFVDATGVEIPWPRVRWDDVVVRALYSRYLTICEQRGKPAKTSFAKFERDFARRDPETFTRAELAILAPRIRARARAEEPGA